MLARRWTGGIPRSRPGGRALAYTRTGDRLLPVLPEVVAALPRGFSPAAVARMRSPWEELSGQSIAGFLAAGGAPEVAAELVAAMGRW